MLKNVISHHVFLKCGICRTKDIIFKRDFRHSFELLWRLIAVHNNIRTWLIKKSGLYDRNVNTFLRCYGNAFSYIGVITRKL